MPGVVTHHNKNRLCHSFASYVLRHRRSRVRGCSFCAKISQKTRIILNDLLDLILNDQSCTTGLHASQQVTVFLNSVKSYEISMCFLEAEATFRVCQMDIPSTVCLQ